MSNATNFEYDLRSHLTKVKDALNQEYTFTYDPLGRQLTQTRAGTTMSFEYDAVGNRKKRTDHMGRVTNYTFDVLNRLTNIQYGAGGDEQHSKLYAYDELSRLTSATNEAGTVAFTYDNRGRLKTETDVYGHVIENGYDAANRRTTLKIDSANYATYSYDLANRLTGITDVSDSTSISFSYDYANRLTSRYYPNSLTTTYEYDGMSRLTRLKDANTAATLFDRQYAYNTANQIAQIAEITGTKTFGYDNIDRLTSVSGTATESYAFDAVGNRTSSHLSSSYSYSPFNRLTATQTANFGYDADGNNTSMAEGSDFWRFGFDRENRLYSASTRKRSVRYQYDALGRRVRRHTPGTKELTKYTYDGLDVIMDDDINSGLTKYVNGPGIDNKLRAANGTNVSYFLADHLGSTNGLTDATGALTASNAYDSFGNPTNPSFPSRFQFTGREYDPLTKLQFSRARFYAPKLGRFISEDPIGFRGNDINLYGYVNDNPTSKNDPTGLIDLGYGSPTGPKPPFSHFPPTKSTKPKGTDWCGPSGSGFWGWAVPDGVGGFNFAEPCKNHDECYGTCGRPKEQCDQNLRTDIEEVCKQAGSQCPGYADKYFKGVTDYYWEFLGLHPGQTAYDSAQQQSGCVTCRPIPRPSPTPRWQQNGCWGGVRGC
ncbi:MAG: hypothetical protein K1X52_11120 [Pyrinomonadaceae bacterium]|nr:hypothetical protein [Pyrinomonadaceae bacterium]